MDWVQTITIVGSLGGLMIYFLNRIERDINQLSQRMDKADSRFEGHATRIDQLYKMFVDLLKAGK